MLDLLTGENFNHNTNSILWKTIDTIYPPFCCSCGAIGFEICPKCFDRIQTIPSEDICLFCGSQLDHNGKCVNQGKHIDYPFEQARSWGFYDGPLKQALRKIKYDRGFGLLKHFAQPLADFIEHWGITFDFIVPVALGSQRKIERGYNQSECIARPVAKLLGHPIIPGALTRTRETRSQVGLNIDQRKHNVAGAFSADYENCKSKNILLFDDITTTFSTLIASTSALLSAGAYSVYCFTVARTSFQQEKEKK